MKTLYVGDVHGNFHYLKRAIKYYNPHRVIQSGDFGVWPGMRQWDNLQGFEVPVYFCEGNHENHHSLPKVVTEMKDNLFYIPRFVEHEGILYIGGANSIDKAFRTPGFDWFPEETITSVPEGLKHVDTIVSHTCPQVVYDDILSRDMVSDRDPSRRALNIVLNDVKPKRWFFSHFHIDFRTTLKGCNFTCLDRVDLGGKLGFNKRGTYCESE